MEVWRKELRFPLYNLSSDGCAFTTLKLEIEAQFNSLDFFFISILGELVQRKLNQWKLDMQMHAEPHKRRGGDYGSQDRLDFSDFFEN